MAAVALALALGTAVRLAPWDRALGGEEAQLLGDTDPHYHVLRAQRIVSDWPRVPDRDPGLNHPYGAEIPWPPLFDQLLAAATLATGGESLEDVTRVAVLAPVLFAALGILLAALAGRALAGNAAGLGAAFLVALLPASVDYGVIGRADQHIVEIAAFTAAILLLVQGLRGGTRAARVRASAGVAAVLALGFWNWLGAPLYLLVLALLLAAWHVLEPSGEDAGRRMAAMLAAGCAGAAVLLVAVVIAFGPPGALSRFRLLGLSGLQPLLCALVAAYAALLAWLRSRREGSSATRRVIEVLGAGLVPLAVALLLPSFRAEAARGLVALLAGNPWYASIDEFQPLLFGSRYGAAADAQYVLASFGLTLPALAISLWPLARLVRREREDRAAPAVLLFWSALFLVLTLASRRFALYLVVPLAIGVAFGVERLVEALARRFPRLATQPGKIAAAAAAYALILAPTVPPLIWGGESSHQPVRLDVQSQLRRVAAEPPRPEREGVLSSWTLGHAALYFARRPVVATPFGTEGGERAMEDSAAFFLERDERAAEDLLRKRRIGYVVLPNPVNDWWTFQPFAPTIAPAVRLEDGIVEFLPGVEDVLTARLFFADGGSTRGAPSLGGFRLVDETLGLDPTDPLRDTRVKLFEVVPGARLLVRGAAPGVRVSAQVPLRTATGRAFTFATWGVADGTGAVELRVPYSTGENGTLRADRFAVQAGERTVSVGVQEAAVREGLAIAVDVAAPHAGPNAQDVRGAPASLP